MSSKAWLGSYLEVTCFWFLGLPCSIGFFIEVIKAGLSRSFFYFSLGIEVLLL